jgi:hypothetical protein
LEDWTFRLVLEPGGDAASACHPGGARGDALGLRCDGDDLAAAAPGCGKHRRSARRSGTALPGAAIAVCFKADVDDCCI